ncbi:MAG: 1-deoxy-D-xylulose-5-phosphate synthase [Clostridia bacterium]|nr:1-deoxy-D-xylulose-5-phosphate synthase [Clostridia bacterium]
MNNKTEKTDLLKTVHGPQDVKRIEAKHLEGFCQEIREALIRSVSKTGGHLSSNLGVVELTVALLRAFDFPQDKIVWDVGHQCYVYKMLTGRLDRMDTIRKNGGISGFPSPKESRYDSFVVGHSSTAVSAANGLAKAKKLTAEDGYTVAVVGDGALTGGLAYEGLSNAGRSNDRLIVILNDNQMSISDNVGFAARHLSSLRARPRYIRLKNAVGSVFRHIPLIGQPIYRLLSAGKNSMKRALYKDVSFFEDMGFYYMGPFDGHNPQQLTRALKTAKTMNRPVVVHVETVKGKGYAFAESDPGTYHGVSRFDTENPVTPTTVPNFSSVFGDCLDRLAQEDSRIVGITAAMKSGTGMQRFADRLPSQCFDTGIAESHAVTFASALAAGGMLPVFAVYATFLQRTYDQLINDTAIMDNHIVLAIDRAGIVPEDGETHQGIFDIPLLLTVPHTTIFAPATYRELELHLKQAIYDYPGIVAVRYPKGGEPAILSDYQPDYQPYLLQEQAGADTLIITYGRLYGNALLAVQQLTQIGRPVSLLKLNRIFPVEPEWLRIAQRYKRVLFFEECAARGGVGELVAAKLLQDGYTGRYTVHAIDSILPPCTVDEGMKMTGLDADSIFEAVIESEA